MIRFSAIRGYEKDEYCIVAGMTQEELVKANAIMEAGLVKNPIDAIEDLDKYELDQTLHSADELGGRSVLEYIASLECSHWSHLYYFINHKEYGEYRAQRERGRFTTYGYVRPRTENEIKAAMENEAKTDEYGDVPPWEE